MGGLLEYIWFRESPAIVYRQDLLNSRGKIPLTHAFRVKFRHEAPPRRIRAISWDNSSKSWTRKSERPSECQSRLGREPFSRAKVSQLSSRGIRIDYRNADACVVAKVEGSLVQGQAPESYPQIELVSLGSAFEAPKEPSRQINREAARIGSLRSVQWACAAKLLSTA
jgi:hypothetical protein